MKFRYTQALIITGLVLISYFYIDQPLALWIDKLNDTSFKVYSADIPSMLLVLVIAVSTVSWSIYGYMRLNKISSRHADFFLMLGTTLPAAYVVKSLLKWVFGRVQTRFWLMHPGDYSLHWFDGYKGYDAFPSGHMLVITQIFLAVWFFYPRLRIINFAVWAGLAILLILTNYHFLADVIAGAYIGALLYLLTQYLINPILCKK